MASMLRRLLEEKLIAEANAEDWLAAPRELRDPAAQPALLEPGQSGRKRSDAWQHDAGGALQIVRV